MSNSDSNDSPSRDKARRNILKTLVAGGGALTAARVTPEQWVKPVVDTVVLPSHAATTDVAAVTPEAPPEVRANPLGDFTSGSVSFSNLLDPLSEQLLTDDTISEELLEFFIPSASAQIVCNVACTVNFSASVTATNASICVSGDVSGGTQLPVVGTAPDLSLGGVPRMMADDLALQNASFQNDIWTLEVLNYGSNTSTLVTLSPGGPGCSTPPG